MISAPRLDCVLLPPRRLPKYHRAKPSWRPHLVLQDRDIEFLKAVADYRLLSTPQLLLLFPESRDAVYRRLQLLFHHGYLDRLRGDPTTPIVYALATRGAAVLMDRGHLSDIGDWRKKNYGLGTLYVAHQAMVGNFRIALTLAAETRSDVELLFFQPESRALRDEVTVSNAHSSLRYPINPDAFFGLRFPDRPEGSSRAYFFLEADRSTMTRERFVRKLEGYQAWYEAGGHAKKCGIKNFRVLTVTKSEARMVNLLQATAAALGLREALGRFWFALETRFTSADPPAIFAPIWELPATPGCRHSLLPA